MTMSNLEASRKVLEKMKTMTALETVNLLAEYQGSDCALTLQRLFEFSHSEHLAFKQQILHGSDFESPTSYQTYQSSNKSQFKEIDFFKAANENLAA